MSQITSTALIELSLDLAQSLTADDRFDCLLTTLRKTITCEAVVVLAYKDHYLQPLALQGLSRETLGRRFIIDEHPRFQRICQSKKTVRFAASCDLPDPYDGLLIDRECDLPVHACMGIPLYFNDKLIGVLTLDSLTPNIFDDIPERTLDVIAAMAAVSLNTALTIELLEANVHHSKQVMAALSQSTPLKKQDDLIGQSPTMQRLKREIGLVAPSNYSVLIQGDSGTGKELVAQRIHQLSNRSEQPIIYVNCAALPESLIESELFGHVKGAFTGADSQRAGKFVVADGGTLFLDEVGELPLAAQSKLLRALQSQEIQAVGQDKVIHVDVRVIAATNRDLANEVEQGNFRSDLFHRLNVYPVSVPALRERHGDIELLVGFFIEKLKRKLGISQLKVAASVLDFLQQYDWPGNVRELEHFLSRSALKASASARSQVVTIELSHCEQLHAVVPLTATSTQSVVTSELATDLTAQSIDLREEVNAFQRKIVKKILAQEQGNWSAAAKRLNVDRANLTRLAKRLGIQVQKVVS
ncbi:nitric oxide reductase transcriptional regulator NorR [Psychrobium sp. 1_MG-2023]|uniref:nitric oxide reductase transcriptional regulator NorR n=1 Tax=Psychrobium sp. 1_MG-2023 TaxID=3062624 RepID=UPI000C32ADC1|nr:nitric oxide reductase transcriptional regulator NorR [Psychrobium sp. 1_MG-2023]MDP2561645.1 nitric oxide reductase transcriptional regulator NorR [Psychrobium sp. 1_MG-2023]PKF55662.1 nitric oxide reductase transcriptional regulator NorR [Alteromonadales bacterium alter-6D02]